MGCLSSYEPKVQPVKKRVYANNNFNINENQNFTNPSVPKTNPYKINYKIPDKKIFELDPHFLDNITKIEKFYDTGLYGGEMKDDKREGKGIMVWEEGPNEGDTYEGEWKNDKMHGKGLYLFKNGKIYSGDFYEGFIEGKGYMKYSDGYYEGDFVKDKREGNGIFFIY